MRTQFHAAVAALFVAFVVILIAIIGLQVVAMRAASLVSFNPLAAPVWLIKMALTLLVLGYLAGVTGWLLAYATRRSGVHRLAAAQTWIARR